MERVLVEFWVDSAAPQTARWWVTQRIGAHMADAYSVIRGWAFVDVPRDYLADAIAECER